MKRQPTTWGSTLIAGALGLLLGLQQSREILAIAGARLTSLVNVPRPRAADWIDAFVPALAVLGRWQPLLSVGSLALAVWLLLRLLHEFHPGVSLRVHSSAPAAPVPWYAVPLDDRLAKRAALAAAVCFYLLGGLRAFWQTVTRTDAPPGLWGLTGLVFALPSYPLLGLVLAFAAGGAILWLLWGERGLLRQAVPRPASSDPGGLPASFPEPAADASSEQPAPTLAAVAGRGAVAGLLAMPLLLPWTEFGQENLGALLAVLSPLNAPLWKWLAGSALVWYPLALVALLELTRVLGPRGRAPGNRARAAMLPALAVVAAAGAISLFSVSFLGDRYDMTKTLWQAVPGLRPIGERRSYLLFAHGRRAWSGIVPYGSIQTLAAGRENRELVWEYLRRRRYQTPFTGALFVHLYDAAAVDWDSSEILKVCLGELENNPQRIFGQLLLEKLSYCPITPENRAVLDAVADTSRFRFGGAFGRDTLVHLHQRFGDLAAARRYSQDGLETTRPTPPLTAGVVSGRLLIDGRPLPGLRIGLVPATQAGGLFGTPRPFEHRWIAAAADADATGHFRIPNLGEGVYLLIAMARDRDLRLRAESAPVTGHPGTVRLDRLTPIRDLGVIDVLLQASPPSLQNSPAREGGERRQVG